MLLPSTITARRARGYTSTLYVHRTIHGVGYNPMNDGRRYTIRSPIVGTPPPTRPTLTPPLTLVAGPPPSATPVGLAWPLCLLWPNLGRA